jgi:hypothetical protein
MLQLALQHGLRLKKVHRVIRFDQSFWLADFVKHNAEMRKHAKNEIESGMWKLRTNSIFGKMMENVRNRRDIKIFYENDWAKAIKTISGPRAKSYRIITQDKLCLIEVEKRDPVKMDKCSMVGQAILDLSKYIMYNHHYNVMVPFFNSPEHPNRLKLHYLDTDSLIYTINGLEGLPVWSEFYALQKEHHCLDLSNIQEPEHPILTCEGVCQYQGRITKEELNKGVLGAFKDVAKGLDVEEAVFLGAKMYSYALGKPLQERHTNWKKRRRGKTTDCTYVCKKKGIPDSVKYTHQDYVDIFFGGKKQTDVLFTSFQHAGDLKLRTAILKKKGIGAFDVKSYWLDPFTCLRHGHPDIDAWLDQTPPPGYFLETAEDLTSSDQITYSPPQEPSSYWDTISYEMTLGSTEDEQPWIDMLLEEYNDDDLLLPE